ncbi:MAG: TPM domain-containing protein [Nitrospiraceae bacterium]|nr:TPM domain-containing protein [Nitrospiraceae bacterium]
MFNKILSCILLCLLCLCASVSSAATPQPPEQPGRRVVDLAGIIDQNAKADIEAYLANLEKATTAQVVVLTINSLDGEDIEGFSIKTAERWRLGQKGNDNGILITVAVKDRKYRIEVGYGLEQIIPDSLAGSIGRAYFVPEFRQGRYSTGISKAVKEIGSRIAAAQRIELKNASEKINPQQQQKTEKPGLLKIIFFIAIGIGALILFITNPELFLMILLLGRGGGGGNWDSGGGFGSSGGFSGGGGDFGGGGASGSW